MVWMTAVPPDAAPAYPETGGGEVRTKGTRGAPRVVVEDVRLWDDVREGAAKERIGVESAPRGKVNAA